jgi:hypothetical protein
MNRRKYSANPTAAASAPAATRQSFWTPHALVANAPATAQAMSHR